MNTLKWSKEFPKIPGYYWEKYTSPYKDQITYYLINAVIGYDKEIAILYHGSDEDLTVSFYDKNYHKKEWKGPLTITPDYQD